MATLVLTTVGGAIGGPIGAALGAIVGQSVDRRLFRPKGREGPRIADLRVQTSSYGAPIARVYGTMRVAGTVIWSTDLIEHATTEGGGKAGPSTTRYSYSASFAVLLSARAIRRVRRIWADGTLLRGGAGDIKVPVKLRVHLGTEEQAPDPLIASAEGLALTSACRGQAYVVFEDLALADYGNRIPSLTFEVEADDAPVRAGDVAADVADGRITAGEAGTLLTGYVVAGGSARDSVEALAGASGAWLAEDAGALVLRTGGGPASEWADEGAGAERPGARGVRTLATAERVPAALALAYYDSARDYQTGLQRAARPGAGGRAERMELPAALEAGAAKAIVERALARTDAERERRTLTLGWPAMGVRPGERVRIAGESGSWRVVSTRIESMVVTLELVRIARGQVSASAVAGRPNRAPDRLAGASVVHAFEIPPIDDALLTGPRMTVAAAGTGSGWRSAALALSLDGGASWDALGSAPGAAVLGHVAVPPPTGAATLVDRTSAAEVVLAHAGMQLLDADAAALDRGANLAMIGDELVQFGRAVRIGEARWRLHELWRGRRGTEWAAGAAVVGDRFVLLDPLRLARTALPMTAVGAVARVSAAGVGDGLPPPTVATMVTGASLSPPSPVHLTAGRIAGGLRVAWVRRSRGGWRWLDGLGTPLGEELEAYRVTLRVDGGPVRTADVPVPEWLAEPALLAGGTAAEVSVRMVGALGVSAPARLMIDLTGDDWI